MKVFLVLLCFRILFLTRSQHVHGLTTSTSNRLRIIEIPVGVGDSALVIFPTGKLMMIDTGGKTNFEEVVLPFLERHCIDHIDYLVKTHNHPDHVGGVGTLKNKNLIDKKTVIWDGETFDYKDRFTLEKVKFFIYNVKDHKLHGKDPNPNSLAFRMEYRGWVYTTGGDEGLKSMNRFMRNHPHLVRAHVRKIAHHVYGPISTKFLRRTNAHLYVATNKDWLVKTKNSHDNAWKSQFVPDVVNHLRSNGGRIDDPGYAVTGVDGFIYITVRNKNDWNYVTDEYNRRSGYVLKDWSLCPKPKMDSSFVTMHAPQHLYVGAKKTVTVRMANTGSVPWKKSKKFRLVSAHVAGSKSWRATKVDLPAQRTVQRGDDLTFKFQITSPNKPGRYFLRWQMATKGPNGLVRFGSVTRTAEILVEERL